MKNLFEEKYETLSIEVEQPKIGGKYIVVTESTGPMKSIRRFEALCFIDDKGRAKFDVNNQVVIAWLKKL